MSPDPSEAEWAALRAEAEALTPAQRKAAADRWSRTAQLEHASIASFARFSLDLLAVAAPPPLLDASHRAGLDELRHAKLTFKVASIYAGAALGPGPLPVDARAFEGRDLEQIVCSAVVEGCIGETLSAFEAQASQAEARPGALKTVFGIIAEEEGAHAELAFRFVAWALAQSAPAIAAAAQRAAALQLEGLEKDPKRRAAVALVRPALEALFSR